MAVPSLPPQLPVSKPTDSSSTEVNASFTVESLMNGLLYGISLPERFVRSAVGLTAGTANRNRAATKLARDTSLRHHLAGHKVSRP